MASGCSSCIEPRTCPHSASTKVGGACAYCGAFGVPLSAHAARLDAVEAYRSLETSLCPAKGECIETKVGVACGLSAQGMYTAAIASFSEVRSAIATGRLTTCSHLLPP